MSTKPKLVNNLLSKYGIPIDLSEILKEEKISLYLEEMESTVSGFLVLGKSDVVIAVNKLHHPNRQRFTIAHELGHYFLHPKRSTTFIDMTETIYMRDNLSGIGINKCEIEANEFAADLLMPEKFLREKVAQHAIDYFDDTLLREIASELKVSIQALSIRFGSLGLMSISSNK